MIIIYYNNFYKLHILYKFIICYELLILNHQIMF